VFNNILRTRRYGAQSTRTGTIDNHVLAVIFADGEIFSNLKLSQKVTDILRARTQFDPPLQLANVRQAMVEAIPKLLFDDRVVAQVYNGDRLDALLKEINGVLGNEDKLAAFIKQIATQARQYAEKHGVLSSSKKQK
jgi:CRISPR-associated protein Csc2